MAEISEAKQEGSKRGGRVAWQKRLADPAAMAKWQKAIQAGRRKADKLRAAGKKKKPARKPGSGHWTKDPKRARAAALKGARTRKRLRRERELAGKQRDIVAHHAPDDLVHLSFPLVASPGQPGVRVNGGDFDDVTQITPTQRKQLALEGLRFVKILLE